MEDAWGSCKEPDECWGRYWLVYVPPSIGTGPSGSEEELLGAGPDSMEGISGPRVGALSFVLVPLLCCVGFRKVRGHHRRPPDLWKPEDPNLFSAVTAIGGAL